METVVSPADVRTAGVLLKEADRYVFCYGPHASGDIYVLRIGGHVETGESPWDCATREAKEEAGVDVRHIPARNSVTTNGIGGQVVPLPGPVTIEGCPERPLVLGVAAPPDPGIEKHTLFLAETTGTAHPRNEIFGLVKLTADQVVDLSDTSHTFGSIETTAESQDPGQTIDPETPILISSHLHALAYCLRHGYA